MTTTSEAPLSAGPPRGGGPAGDAQVAAAMHVFLKETGGWVAAQLEACTRCAICAPACHFYQATGNREYIPIWKVEPLKRAYEQRFTPSGRLKLALGIDRRISDEDLAHWARIVYYACTMCNKCAMVCPMGIQLGPIIHEVRAAMAAAGLVPADLEAATEKQMTEGSPLGVSDDVFEERMEWIADEWEVEIPTDVQGADTLVVFTSIEIMKFPQNIAAVAEIMTAAGEKWTISSKGREAVLFGLFEGSSARTAAQMKRVFDAAVELGVKRIMISECGHAYDGYRWSAANMMDVPRDIEVTHIVKMTHEFWKSGRIKIARGSADAGGTLTFHDSCKIQRRGGLIQEPRDLLAVLAPESFVEMSPNKAQSLCCGGGGGVIAIKDADPERYAVFELKRDQMARVGAKRVAMCCSNCRLQHTESVAHFDLDVKVVGLTQLVADALET